MLYIRTMYMCVRGNYLHTYICCVHIKCVVVYTIVYTCIYWEAACSASSYVTG